MLPPPLTIVIATLNHERFIGECLASAQEVPGAEVIVVDGGSTDGTLGAVAAAPGVARVIRADREPGAPVPMHEGFLRNLGLAAARGELILFLDGDDFLYPAAAGRLAAALLAEPGLGFVFGDLDIGDSEGHVYSHSTRECRLRQREGFLFGTMLAEGFIHIHALIFRRAVQVAVGGFDGSTFFRIDYENELRLMSRYPGRYCPGTVGYYRRHPGGLTARVREMKGGTKGGTRQVLLRVLAEPERYKPGGQLTTAERSWLYFNLGKSALYLLDFGAARRELRQAIGFAPGALGFYPYLAAAWLRVDVAALRQWLGRRLNWQARGVVPRIFDWR